MEEFLNPDRLQLRSFSELKSLKFNDEGRPTLTSKEQVLILSSFGANFDFSIFLSFSFRLKLRTQ